MDFAAQPADIFCFQLINRQMVTLGQFINHAHDGRNPGNDAFLRCQFIDNLAFFFDAFIVIFKFRDRVHGYFNHQVDIIDHIITFAFAAGFLTQRPDAHATAHPFPAMFYAQLVNRIGPRGIIE